MNGVTTSSARFPDGCRLPAAGCRLPPLIPAVVVVETTVDASGRPSDVKVVRGPSHAPDVTAAVVEMIRRASPLPAPTRLAGNFKFIEIWLVTKDGRFQLDALTEGKN